jgi:hypothetical protein
MTWFLFWLARDGFKSNRHRALAYWLRMIFFGKPLHTFPDHALEPFPF